MKLLVSGLLLCGLWAVAHCQNVTTTTSSPTKQTTPASNETSPSQPTPAPVSPQTSTVPTSSTPASIPTTPVTPVTTPSVSSTTPLPTTLPVTNGTTVLPTTTVSPTVVPPPERHFDTLSFLGGIILTLGCLAICYVGFKFYKARTERNYHTL